MVHLTELQERFKDRVNFHFVYITEAHPEHLTSELTELFEKKPEGLCPVTPMSQKAALAALRGVGVELPILFDIDGKAEEMFRAGPTSLMLLSPGGSVLHVEHLLGSPTMVEGGEKPAFQAFGEWLEEYFRSIYKPNERPVKKTML